MADYYLCDGCNIGYNACGEYVAYCNCGAMFCHKDCASFQNYQDEPDTDNYDYELCHRIDKSLPATCVICRNEVATDYGLLTFLLKHFSLTREEAFELYKKEAH